MGRGTLSPLDEGHDQEWSQYLQPRPPFQTQELFPYIEDGDYFLLQSWYPTYMSFSLYTETELRNIHRIFGYPTIHATDGFPSRATGETLPLRTGVTTETIECDFRYAHRTQKHGKKNQTLFSWQLTWLHPHCSDRHDVYNFKRSFTYG